MDPTQSGIPYILQKVGTGDLLGGFLNLKCQIPPAGEMLISKPGAENMQDEPAGDILSPPKRKKAIKDLEANFKGAPTGQEWDNVNIQKNDDCNGSKHQIYGDP